MKCILCSVEPKDPRESKRGLHLNCALTFIQDRREKGVEADAQLAKSNRAYSFRVRQLEEQVRGLQEENNILDGRVQALVSAAQVRSSPPQIDQRWMVLDPRSDSPMYDPWTTSPWTQARRQGSPMQATPLATTLASAQVLKIMALCMPDTNELSIQLHPEFRACTLGRLGDEILVLNHHSGGTIPVQDRVAAQMYDAFAKAQGEGFKLYLKALDAYQWSATFGPDPSKNGYFLIKVSNRPLQGKDRFSLIELE